MKQVSLVKLLLESESGGEHLYHFTTLLDGLQIVNPNIGSLQWSLAARKGDGSVPYFSLTSKSSFNSGYPLIQKNSAIAASKDLEDLKVVRITFDKARLENYAVDSYHYDTAESSGSLKAALDMIEDPNDKDEAEVRITRKSREETLQDLRDSITSVDILVADWIYQNFAKTLRTKNKFEGLIRSYFDPSKNAFVDETHVVNYKDGKERREAEFWKDKKNYIRSGHRLTSGEQFTDLRTKYGYSNAEIKQLGHLVAYCGQLLPGGALHYFDSLSADEVSALGDAAEKSPGNADAAKNAYRTLNIQNKFKGSQKAVLKCILNMVDDFEDYLKKEGILDPNRNYRFDEIVDIVKKEGYIEEAQLEESIYNISREKLEQDAEREFHYGYDYSEVPDKVKTNEKVPVVCPIHGRFYKSPENLKRGFGCPRCAESQPERIVARYFRAKGLDFDTQLKVFCADGRERPVDFYFPDFYGPGKDAAIEVQGPSHGAGIPTRSAEAKAKQDIKLVRQKTSDRLKKQYCEDNHVVLEYIPKDDSEPLARSVGGLEYQAEEALERLRSKSMNEGFDFRKYLAEDWMHKEAKSLKYDDSVYDLLEVPDSTVLQAVADFAFDEPVSIDSFEDEEKKEILAFILTDLSRGRYDPEAEAVGPYLKAQIGPIFS